MPARKNKRKSKSSIPTPLIKKVDYIGIDHKVVNEKINPNVKFVNYMSIKNLSSGTRFVGAVYFDPKPNKELNHSDYMIISSHYDPATDRSQLYVTGRSPEQMEENRFHNGTMCAECGLICVSLTGHHFHGCECPNGMFVDGGQEKYGTRVGAKDLSKTVDVVVDMLTDTFEVAKRRDDAEEPKA